ncbi:MAG: hypothetical protein HRT88_08795 [Lentisphaeraceae bacterium]|nr:hypothetical protein [Lentisphaeraceae bacterium]
MIKSISVTLLAIAMCCTACGDKSAKGRSTKTVVGTGPEKTEAKPLFIDRHVIDLKEDEMGVDQLLKIDAEIPVIELVANDKWTQADYLQLSKTIMLESLRLEEISLDDMDLAFVSQIKSLKTLSLLNSSATDKSIVQLQDSSIVELDLSGNEDLTLASIKVLEKMPKLKRIIMKSHALAREFRRALSIRVIMD